MSSFRSGSYVPPTGQVVASRTPRSVPRQVASRAVALGGRLFDHLVSFGCLALIPLLLLLAQSILWADAAPREFKALVVLFGVLSFSQPHKGLLAVAALAPFGRIVVSDVYDAYPTRASEALVLAFLAGYVLRTWRPGRRPAWLNEPFAIPVVLFGTTAIASCAVLVGTQQVWQDYPMAFAATAFRFLTFGYHDMPGDVRPWIGPPGFEYMATTALLVECLALLLIVARFCRADGPLARRLAGVLVLSGVGAALLSINSVAIDLFRPLVQTPKLNTAAAYFVLLLPLALASVYADTPRRHLWLAAAATLAAALLLNGTRAALLAGAALLVAASWYLAPTLRRRVLWLCATAIATGAIAAPFLLGNVRQAITSLQYRLLITQTSLRMMAENPAFGIGVNQYYLWSAPYSTSEFLENYSATSSGSGANAHNYFFQIGAELGAIGLLFFLMVLGSVLLPAWKASRGRWGDPLLLGTLGGSTAFLLTCLTNNALLLPIVAYPFWIMLGLCAASALQPNDVPRSSAPASVLKALRYGSAPVLVLLLIVASVPVRVYHERAGVDYSWITYGLSPTETGATGRSFRWTGRRATFFVAGQSESLTFRLMATRPAHLLPVNVEVLVDGDTAVVLKLNDHEWHRTRLDLRGRSPEGRRFRRIDLRVSPTWSPAKESSRSTDDRELGVMLGQVRLTPNPQGEEQDPDGEAPDDR